MKNTRNDWCSLDMFCSWNDCSFMLADTFSLFLMRKAQEFQKRRLMWFSIISSLHHCFLLLLVIAVWDLLVVSGQTKNVQVKRVLVNREVSLVEGALTVMEVTATLRVRQMEEAGTVSPCFWWNWEESVGSFTILHGLYDERKERNCDNGFYLQHSIMSISPKKR